MSRRRCPSCCATCFIDAPAPKNLDPLFALQTLLKVGTTQLSLNAAVQHSLCNHSHAGDDWHWLDPTRALPKLKNEEETLLCGGLRYLIQQKFLLATYREFNDRMTIRIYLIQHDLPNVQGRLRKRKENVLSIARKHFQILLPRISRDESSWNGVGMGDGSSPFLPDLDENHTLGDIYSALPSPQVTPPRGFDEISCRLLDNDDTLMGFGLRSSLFSYQRRSVATMLQKELDPADIPDPLFIPMRTLDSKPFYFQPGTCEILTDQPRTASCRGGILCEELGTGKTVMILGLVMATRNQLPSPEPSIVEDRPVLTPLSFRHFPSKKYTTARKRLGGVPEPDTSTREVPTLVELLVEKYRTNPPSHVPKSDTDLRYLDDLHREDLIQSLPLGDMIHANLPFYFQYPPQPLSEGRAPRQKANLAPRKMYLTSATLIVVPANLLSQWDREIIKHCEVPLRVLVLRSDSAMPRVQQLATDYDVVLTTYIRFSAEAKNDNVAQLHSRSVCKCPDISQTIRVPHCSCQINGVSPLLQIRWKRLVIDEGHVSSTITTNLVPFAKLLSVERRWIVTGTPTTNLLGLSFGSTPNEDMEVDAGPSSSPIPSPRAGDFDTPDLAPSHPENPPQRKRIWTKSDREDLNKLGNMIGHFIAVPQFQADFKLVSTHVIEPLMNSNGPLPGSIQVLNQVMQSAMVRHRIEDVERDVALPLVTQEAVLLDLEPCVIKSFNALQAIITINAVDSERRHQDYMFHPRNADYLQETVQNMSQILFWHIDEEMYNAQQLLSNADEIRKRAIERNVSFEDQTALERAFRHLEIAMEDPAWKEMQRHEDVPYRVYNVDPTVFNVWSRINQYSDDDPDRFMHVDRLAKLRKLVIQRPLLSSRDACLLGERVAYDDHIIRREYIQSLKRKGKGTRRPKNLEQLSADNYAKKAFSSDTIKEIQKEFDISMARLNQEDEDIDVENQSAPAAAPPTIPDDSAGSSLLALSSYSKIRVGSSGSSKLNYILDEVLKHSSEEKFLIFSDSPLTLAHMAEGLSLARVKFLRFTTQSPPKVREQTVLTFETSEVYRVFLMELRHGARGLNLVSASRIIFCEPVWQPDVESQAIKRAHRIGQTRPISVKTLAIRGTSEENMVARRAALRGTQGKLPKPIEETGIRHFIANPKFLDAPPNLTRIDIPLFNVKHQASPPNAPESPLILRIPARSPKPPPPTPGTPTRRVRVEDPLDEDDQHISPSPPKRRKMIHFAEPPAFSGMRHHTTHPELLDLPSMNLTRMNIPRSHEPIASGSGSPSRPLTLRIPARSPETPPQTQPTPIVPIRRVRVEDPLDEEDQHRPSPSKRKKTIHFADDA